MNLPRFTPAARPTIPTWRDWKPGAGVDVDGEPTCVCGAHGQLDEATGLCRACWRVTILQTAYLHGIAPADDLESRRVPVLTDATGTAGISLGVDLERPRRR